MPTSSVTEVSSKLETRTRQLVHMQAKVIDAQTYICCSHVSILHSVKRTQDSPLCITVCGLSVRMHCSVMLHFTVYHSLWTFCAYALQRNATFHCVSQCGTEARVCAYALMVDGCVHFHKKSCLHTKKNHVLFNHELGIRQCSGKFKGHSQCPLDKF